MSWSIGLNLGQSLIEIAAQHNDTLIKFRAFTQSLSPENALNQFLLTHNVDGITKVQVVEQWPSHIVDAQLGSPFAFLTTANFEGRVELARREDWLFKVRNPTMISSYITSDSIFGLSERVNSHGHIERLIDLNELEFIHTKLELLQIKTIGIGLINSWANPENEDRTEKFFLEKGYRVFKSSSYTSVNPKEAAGEIARFNRAAMNAYCDNLWTSKAQKIIDILAPKLSVDATFFWGGRPVKNTFVENKIDPMDCLSLFYDHLASQFALTSDLLYAGVEEFVFIPAGTTPKSLLSSQAGPIQHTHRQYRRPKIQPLSIIGKGFFSDFEILNDVVNLDPGPMCFGRGLTPTLFDIAVENARLDNLNGIKERIQARGAIRLDEQLMAYARNSVEQGHFSKKDLKEGIWKTAIEILNCELTSWRQSEQLNICGPLAQGLSLDLGAHLLGDDFFHVTSLLVGNKNAST